MSFNHKCHFHPQYSITKFCPKDQCTLPLCQECEPIHLDEHHAQKEQVTLIRFSQAYNQAQSEIQSFLSQQKKRMREYQRQLNTDRESVIRYFDSYYARISKAIEQNKGKCHQLQQKLNKLRKGSIKTLIFYFSGDIELNHEQIQFQPLMDRISKEIKEEPATQLYNTKYQRYEAPPQRYEAPPQRYEAPLQLSKDYHKIHSISAAKLNKGAPLDQGNVFSSIDEVKFQDKNRQKGRKSIFQNNTKKTEVVTPQEKPQNRSPSNKYNYNINPAIENQEDEARQPFRQSPQLRKDYTDTSKISVKERPLAEQQQTPVSFENRYKFTGSQQYEIFRKEREDKVFKEININQSNINPDRTSNISEKITDKVLKSSDFDFHLVRQEKVAKPNQSPIGSQRMRCFSQTNIATASNEARNDNNLYDLKKQVLSPEEIRKMLEKRMEERNRILSIKKSQNYSGGTNDEGKKGWETRDSIINQIYNDPKN